MIRRKIRDIQKYFASVMRERIERYQTDELRLGDSWPDLPSRLFTGLNKVVLICSAHVGNHVGQIVYLVQGHGLRLGEKAW